MFNNESQHLLIRKNFTHSNVQKFYNFILLIIIISKSINSLYSIRESFFNTSPWRLMVIIKKYLHSSPLSTPLCRLYSQKLWPHAQQHILLPCAAVGGISTKQTRMWFRCYIPQRCAEAASTVKH
jgi:hypothetical protein